MAKKGFTGNEIYFQDKFNEFDWSTRYNRMKPKEGFAQMWEDIKNSDFIEDMKMEEDELGKLPPLPTSWATGILRLLKPAKGLYELEKKTGGLGVSMFKTIAGDASRRQFLQNMIGKTKSFKDAQFKELLKKAAEEGRKNAFKFPGKAEMKKFYDKTLKEMLHGKTNGKSTNKQLKNWDITGKTKHAEGGLAGMLGEPRSGYNGGGGAGYQDYWTMVQESYSNAGGQDATGMNIQDFAQEYFPRPGRAEGGRIGLAEGDTPSQAWMRDYFYSSGYDDQGVITLDEYINGPIGWKDYMEHGPGKAKGGRIGYDNGGPVDDDGPPATKDSFAMNIFSKPYDELTKIQQIEIDGFFSFVPEKAQGGRIGFKEGEGIMSRVGNMVNARNVPYYAGEGLQGLVNSAETLSKFPLAAGHLGSKLLREKPNKEMFMEAIEDITPGSWSENLGLTSLVEGMEEKRPDEAKTVGNILGLGTEVAVPTGGAFKAGQFLLSKASKAMGKVKEGKTLNKLVEDKISDSGQSRRDFNIMAATSGLMVALKTIGLGGLLKAGAKKDIGIKFKKQFVNDDVDYGTSGLMNFDLVGKTKAGKEFLKKFLNLKKGVSSFDDLEPAMVKKILKAAEKNKLSTSVDDLIEDGVSKVKEGAPDPTYYARPNWSHKILGPGKEMFKKFKKRFNKQTTKENIDDFVQEGNWHYENDQWKNLENLPGSTKIWSEPKARSTIKDIIDIIEPIVKKAEGGRIGLDTGGLADMLGERTGFPKGKRVRKQPKKPKKNMTIDEAIADINKKLKAPDITDDESRRLRVILHDLILGPGMGGPRGDKIYQSEEDLPEGILELLQKDPAFDFEDFSEIEWSPEGLRWTDKGHPGEGNRGMAGPMGVWSGMAPFGETVYMDEGRGPRNKNIHLKDLDKAKIINHELRHNLMGDEGSPLHHTQPEWVKEYKGRNYLRSKDDKPIGTSGHELYNRFIDSRLFPGEKDPGPNAPYFDKILRDHWEPNFQKYKKGVKELKSKPEHLSAEGGRIGLQTGGPPITLQRPMFNDGGLTKTIPPKRGPDPQGLPSALYNGIMRPRSY